jgi:hypothetical protein
MISKTTSLAKNTYNRSFEVVVSFAIIVMFSVAVTTESIRADWPTRAPLPALGSSRTSSRQSRRDS